MADGIPYSLGLLLSLEKSLGTSFNQPYLWLTKRPTKPGATFRVSLGQADRTIETDDGAEQNVVPIRLADGQPSTFYFSFAARFEIKTNRHTLQHASLSVFHDVYAGEITPLFRAEWDQAAASDVASLHAQPHWHFVQRPERIEGIVRSLLTPSAEFVPQPESDIFSGIVDCGKIHFAMTSLWDRKEPSCHKQLFEASDFPKWFASLTRYLANQIAYAVSKAPSKMATTNFSPSQHGV